MKLPVLSKFSHLSAALFLLVAAQAQAASVTYSGITFPEGDKSFADKVIASGLGAFVSGTYADPQDVLGSPDFDGTNGSFSLGNPTATSTPSLSDPLGFVTIQFTDNSLTTSGNADADLFVFEIGGAVERYTVEISKDNSSWITVATIIGQPSTIDIDAVLGVNPGDKFSFVRVTDATGGASSGSPFGGPDIDAIGAISSAAPVPPPAVIPLPAAGWALIAGLGMLFQLRRRT